MSLTRRELLYRTGAGFGWLAAASLLADDQALADVRRPLDGDDAAGGDAAGGSLRARPPHHPARALRVIFLFMKGGPSQVDTFDYKPNLQRDDGKELPFEKPRVQFSETGTLLASPWQFRQHGQSGAYVSELFPNVAGCVDDLCFIHSLHGTNAAHGGAVLKLHTGTDRFVRPSMGSWVIYGLGSENRDLPGFITICPTLAHGGVKNFGAAFLPTPFQGVPLGNASLPSTEARMRYIRNDFLTPTEQRVQLDAIGRLNEQWRSRPGLDRSLEGRLQSFELAFRMQSAFPEAEDLSSESEETLRLYGLDSPVTANFARQCLLARRFSERGVRFVQVTHSDDVDQWDQHGNLKRRHAEKASEVDRPIAGLLIDLKRRGLLDDTLVVWGGEFGRTPVVQGGSRDGRDHNPHGFTMWLAGGGSRAGTRYGATDEYGFYAAEDKVHVHDLHATILHLLGLDHERLTYRYAGRDFRLTDVDGRVVREVLA